MSYECPVCKGSGRVSCLRCRGSGFEQYSRWGDDGFGGRTYMMSRLACKECNPSQHETELEALMDGEEKQGLL